MKLFILTVLSVFVSVAAQANEPQGTLYTCATAQTVSEGQQEEAKVILNHSETEAELTLKEGEGYYVTYYKVIATRTNETGVMSYDLVLTNTLGHVHAVIEQRGEETRLRAFGGEVQCSVRAI